MVPAGTVVVMLVEVLTLTTAVVPLNLTVLFAAVGLKLVPVIMTEVPLPPPVGLKLEMVGTTVKLLELVAV